MVGLLGLVLGLPKDLVLELVGQAHGGDGVTVGRRRLLAIRGQVLVAGATASSVVVGVLARPDGGLRDNVLVRSHFRLDSRVADVGSTCSVVKRTKRKVSPVL